MQTFQDSKHLSQEKMLDNLQQDKLTVAAVG